MFSLNNALWPDSSFILNLAGCGIECGPQCGGRNGNCPGNCSCNGGFCRPYCGQVVLCRVKYCNGYCTNNCTHTSGGDRVIDPGIIIPIGPGVLDTGF